MKIHRLTLGIYQANCYIVQSEQTNEAFIIDPGDEAEQIQALLEREQIQPGRILLTHGHIDHFGAAAELQDFYRIPMLMHEGDRLFVENATIIGGMMGYKRVRPPKIDRFFQDDEELVLAEMKCKVLHTPGHSQGSVCFLFDDVFFSGDTIFAGSVGRVDLPGGDWNALISSIRTRIFILSDHIRIFPGHGEETTVKDEKLFNPFLHI